MSYAAPANAFRVPLWRRVLDALGVAKERAATRCMPPADGLPPTDVTFLRGDTGQPPPRTVVPRGTR